MHGLFERKKNYKKKQYFLFIFFASFFFWKEILKKTQHFNKETFLHVLHLHFK